MNLSILWGITHAWNENRKHKRCMVAIADQWDISSDGLVLDWVNACTHGSLLTLDEVKGRQAFQSDAGCYDGGY
jgi:hypothetical protein